MNERPPTLRTLAAELGVSHATVSMALRNDPSISVAMRKRVQALARKRNYRGNILVSALLTQVRRRRVDVGGEVIAVLVEGMGIQHAPVLMGGVWEEVQQHAWRLGMKLEIFPLGHRGQNSAHAGRVILNRGIRGIIVTPMPLDLLPLQIDWKEHATVAVGYSFQQQNVHRVAHSHFCGLIECYRQLRAAGWRRIGCALQRETDARSLHYWQAAALCAPRLHGGAAIEPLLLGKELDEAELETWFEAHTPDAIIGSNPDYVPAWLRKRGVRVPGKVAYASLDLSAGAKWPGIHQFWPGIFSAAVDQLAGSLARNEFGLPPSPRVTLVDGVWKG